MPLTPNKQKRQIHHIREDAFAYFRTVMPSVLEIDVRELLVSTKK